MKGIEVETLGDFLAFAATDFSGVWKMPPYVQTQLDAERHNRDRKMLMHLLLCVKTINLWLPLDIRRLLFQYIVKTPATWRMPAAYMQSTFLKDMVDSLKLPADDTNEIRGVSGELDPMRVEWTHFEDRGDDDTGAAPAA